MRLGLIGCGRHGARYLLEQNGGRRFTRVLTRTPRTDLPDWVKGTTDPNEFFAPGLDGVVIATPTETHVAIALEAMRRGLDVLCEKPLASTWQDIAMLQSASRTLDQRLCVAHTDTFHASLSGRDWPFGYGYEGPKDVTIELGGPDGSMYEWAPHGAALAVLMLDPHKWSWRMDSDDWTCAFETATSRCSLRLRRGPKIRRIDVQLHTTERIHVDLAAPSDPTPIANMLDVFVSGKPDRRMSYDFTRAVYRVLLTDPD